MLVIVRRRVLFDYAFLPVGIGIGVWELSTRTSSALGFLGAMVALVASLVGVVQLLLEMLFWRVIIVGTDGSLTIRKRSGRKLTCPCDEALVEIRVTKVGRRWNEHLVVVCPGFVWKIRTRYLNQTDLAAFMESIESGLT